MSRLLDQPQLQEALGLPQTVKLVKRFVDRTGRLPLFQIDVYLDLRTGLESQAEIQKLESHAWRSFCGNERFLPTPSVLSDAFEAEAVDAGILTRVVENQGSTRRTAFTHDRIRAHFVAAYLDRQPSRHLSEWTAEVREDVPRGDLRLVLEMWAEMWARRVHEGSTAVASYQAFMLEVARVEPEIFRDVYRQANHFDASGLLTLDASFVKQAAQVMAST